MLFINCKPPVPLKGRLRQKNFYNSKRLIMIEKKMFYKANPLIFARAKELRNNMTAAEILLWGYLKTDPFGYKFSDNIL